jgi:amidase
VLFKDFIPTRDATIVVRLRNAGAVIVAKTTMGEFASGYLGSAFGIVRNAYDQTRIASGSSGGTGAGIAANFATVGIGEDTGGSVRGPAAANNLVGLRPTTQLVSRHGMLPARPSTDTLAPIARSVKDAAIVLDVLAGYNVYETEAATDAYLAKHANAPVRSLREILLSGTVVPGRARTLIASSATRPPNRGTFSCC